MPNKNIVVPIAIMGAVALIIIGGYIILNSNPSSDEQTKINGSNETEIIYGTSGRYVVIESKEIKEETKGSWYTNFGELNVTDKPKFKVGEKYYYHRWSKRPDTENTINIPEEYDTIVEVQGVERINKSDYYILNSKNVSVSFGNMLKKENDVWVKKEPKDIISVRITSRNGTVEKEISHSPFRTYEGCVKSINKENGETREVISNNPCFVLNEMFDKWMLYLDKEVKWVKKSNTSSLLDKGDIRYEEEWEVKDIEKINERECFKVVVVSKTEFSGRERKQISGEITTYWIDKEKRILVKMERKEDGILTETVELKDYKNA